MRRLLTILIVLVLAALPLMGDTDTTSAPPQASAKAIRVGTFDSRGVAYAYYMSEEQRKLSRERREALEEAKAQGDKKRLKQLEEKARPAREKRYRQIFGRGPIDEILERLQDRLPQVAREAGVDLIVERVCYARAGVETLDVTELMAKQFKATKETLRLLRELMKRPPVEFDRRGDHAPTEGAPCFRPKPDAVAEKLFLSRLGKATVTVFPAVVRRPNGASHDLATRDALVKLVGTEGAGKPKASETKVDLGPIKGQVQWDVYRSSLTHFVKHLRTHPVDTEFAVLVEFLISPEGSGGEAVRAIHCFILDAQRRNAASFLMNSNHGPFQRAQLRVADRTLGAGKKLMAAATRALLESLREQLAGYGAQRTGLD